MFPQCFRAPLMFLLLLVGFLPLSAFGAVDATPPATPQKLVFIHHSTGGHWLADPNDYLYGGLGKALMENNYYVSATNYCWDGVPNDDIGNRTDIVNWPEWFTGGNRDAITTALYNENDQNFENCDGDSFGSWSRLADDPGGENAIIMFKSCFPNSNLSGNPDDPALPEPNEEYSVGNAKAVYNHILTYFQTRQDKLFVVVTAPPLAAGECSAESAANARAFNNWLVNDWLSEYAHKNVAVFDYFNILTHPDNHHRVAEGIVEHVISPASGNCAYYPSDDSHPNTTGQRKATAEFAPLLNVFYNTWKNAAPPVSKPIVLTGAATNVTAIGARLNGTVNPNGYAATCHFEYGPTNDYGMITPVVQVGDGKADVAVNADIAGLSPDSTHHYRLVAANSQGDSQGEDETLKTLPAPPVIKGDINGDGVVNLKDAVAALKACAGMLQGGLVLAAEVNNDGRIGLAEAIYALQHVAGVEYSPPASKRLQPADLEYVGAFRLPDAFNWGGRGICFYPGGDNGGGTLLVTGFELLYDPAHPNEGCWNESWNCFAYFGEVAIPQPVKSSNWESLPEAALINPLRSYDGGLAAGVHREYVFVSGIQYVPRRGTQSTDKIYGSINLWFAEGAYGEDTFPTVWFSNMDGTSARGMFYVGPNEDPYHGRKMGSYLFTVPSWYADAYLGGRTLVTGRSRGTPLAGEAVSTDGGSQGPTLFAFHPFDNDNPSGNLDALPMLYYRVKFPGCAGPNVGDKAVCDYPDFTMCDDWTGGAFVESGEKKAILLLGYKGLGNNCYDEPPVDCHDECNNSHGYHCQPYERQVIFYDVAEIGKNALGKQDPWSVVPYTIWRPGEFYMQGNPCWNAGGMAFDAAGKRLFMVERGFGEGESNSLVVHVWRVR